MAHKHLKNFGMAAITILMIVLGCAFGVAQAAGGPSPPPIDPSQLRTLLKLKPGAPLPQSGGGRLTPGSSSTAGPSLTIGWNFETCSFSEYATDSTNYWVFAVNYDRTFFFWNNLNRNRNPVQEELLAACQNGGHGYFVEVTDTSALTFDRIYVPPSITGSSAQSPPSPLQKPALPQSGGGKPGLSFATGWNFAVCNASEIITSAGTTIVAVNIGGTILFDITYGHQPETSAQGHLIAACKHGQGGYWVHIVDPSVNAFDAIEIVYP
jgi:hypothetical protein